MQVDFNAFRKRTVAAYNRLCEEINSRIDSDDEIGKGPHGDIFVVGDIYDEMQDLRNGMVTLICLEDPENGIEAIDMPVSVFAPEE